MWATSRGSRETAFMANTSGRDGSFALVDTGGIVPDDPELIPTEIYNQAKVALEEADALVLVVDARTELASPDYDLVRLLIRGGKPVFLAVNKVEGEAMAMAAENFRQLGIRNVFSPSARSMGWGSAICWMRLRRRFRSLSRSRKRSDQRRISEGRLSATETDARTMRRLNPRFPPRRIFSAKAISRQAIRRRSKKIRRMRSTTGRMGSLSSTRLRWPLSGGRTWANRRC